MSSAHPTISTNGQKSDLEAGGIASGKSAVPKPPSFDDPLDARQYLKERLVLAFRIFAKLGYDEG